MHFQVRMVPEGNNRKKCGIYILAVAEVHITKSKKVFFLNLFLSICFLGSFFLVSYEYCLSFCKQGTTNGSCLNEGENNK